MTEAPASADLADLFHIGRLVLALGEVERATVHVDGVRHESDTTHSVMTAYLACSLAARYYPHLDLGLIAQYAIVHDAVEIYAGDTVAFTRDDAGREAQRHRETLAYLRLREECARMPWLPDRIASYEAQAAPEARFVRAIDKLAPKVVVNVSGVSPLTRHGIDCDGLKAFLRRERAELGAIVSEFPEVFALFDELCERSLRRVRAAVGGAP